MRRFAVALVAVPLLISAKALSAQNSPELQQTLEAIVASHHGPVGDVGLFAENLRTGETVALHPDEPVETASVIKLTILYEAMEQIRDGKAHLQDQIVLHKDDQVAGSGMLRFFDTPMPLTLKDALTMMVITSDNTATNLVIDHLGLARINQRIQSLGLKNTYLYKKVFKPAEGVVPSDQPRFGLGKTTPREMAEVMSKIVRCDLATPDEPARPSDQPLCAVVLDMLTNQFYRNAIPRFLEKLDTSEGGSAIANKTGSVNEVRNDVAAIHSKNGVLILSIFTSHNQDRSWTSDNEAEFTISKLAEAIVAAWSPSGLTPFPKPTPASRATSPSAP